LQGRWYQNPAAPSTDGSQPEVLLAKIALLFVLSYGVWSKVYGVIIQQIQGS